MRNSHARFTACPFGAGFLIVLMVLASTLTGCRWTSTGQNTVGVGMFQQQRYSEALQQFQPALRSDPSNPATYYNLASTYHRIALSSKQKDERLIHQAESWYHQCLDLQPNHVDCHRGLAVLLAESGRPDSGIRLLKDWAAKNPQASAPRVELARLYQEFGDASLAERYLDEAINLNTNDFRAWAAKGQMREKNGDLQQAKKDYEYSLALNNQQPELYRRVASVNAQLMRNAATQIANASSQPEQPDSYDGMRR